MKRDQPIRVWMAPSHSNGSKFVEALRGDKHRFGPYEIIFEHEDHCKSMLSSDPKNCDLVWLSNTAGGNVKLPDSFYNTLDDFIENKTPRPLVLSTFIVFFHDYGDTDNYRLCPVFGVNDGHKVTDSPSSDSCYTILNRDVDVWQNVTLTNDTFTCNSYQHTHYPTSGSWLNEGVLGPGVTVFARNKKGDAAMWINSGHEKNPRLLSAYVSQMLEYSTHGDDLQLLYNIIVWLVAQQLPVWTPECHWMFSPAFKEQVITLLLMAQRDNKGKPYHSETFWYKLPKEIIYSIIQYL